MNQTTNAAAVEPGWEVQLADGQWHTVEMAIRTRAPTREQHVWLYSHTHPAQKFGVDDPVQVRKPKGATTA